MPPDRTIRHVAVIGGGVVAHSAAAALRRRTPWIAVTLVPTPIDPAALADTMMPTLPSIHGFHADLRLSDQDTVARSGSALRLGTRFVGWAAHDYVHAYGAYGQALGSTPFHLQWLRLARAGQALPFDHYAPAALLARRGHTSGLPEGVAETGLQLDLPRYAAMLAALVRHCGVRVVPEGIAGVDRRADGGIDAVITADGTRCTADLFIDAAGPASPLRPAGDGDWDDWSAGPGCDRMIRVTGPATAVVPPCDTVTAFAAGWHWSAATASHAEHGICYASRWCDDDTAAQVLAGACGIMPGAAPVVLRPGTRRTPWRGNCVAIGDAATAIEPLEWTNLHLAHSAIDRIIAMLPDCACDAVELAEYNRQTLAEVTRVRDFVLLHYAACHRDDHFWQAAAGAPLPPSLAHTLALFRDRGRLPVYAEETFARDSWLAVLLGQGEAPARLDPLAQATPLPLVAQTIQAMGAALAAALPAVSPSAALAAQSGPMPR